jgi:hypothetical protein
MSPGRNRSSHLSDLLGIAVFMHCIWRRLNSIPPERAWVRGLFRNLGSRLPRSVSPLQNLVESCSPPQLCAGSVHRPTKAWQHKRHSHPIFRKGRFRHSLAEAAERAVLPCCHACQSIQQLRTCGTKSHRRGTEEKGEQKLWATLGRKVDPEQGVLEARLRARLGRREDVQVKADG